MTLVASGVISIGGSTANRSINLELGRTATAQSNLNEADLRSLAGVASGAISLANFYGKTNTFNLTISSNTTNLNLRTTAINAGWNGSTYVIATINSGVVISGSVVGVSTGALTIDGSWPNGVRLVNNGVIVGRGGAGGKGQGIETAGTAGEPGGRALHATVACTVANYGTIAGGGGGGGGGDSRITIATYEVDGNIFTAGEARSSGSGGGGGRSSNTASTAGIRGDFPGSFYAPRTARTQGYVGSAGGYSAAGAGGAQAPNATTSSDPPATAAGGGGGAGGAWGQAGAGGKLGVGVNQHRSTTAGGGTGRAIDGNSNITWIATGTRSGAIV